MTYRDEGFVLLNAPSDFDLPSMEPGATLTVTKCVDYVLGDPKNLDLVVESRLAFGEGDTGTWPLT